MYERMFKGFVNGDITRKEWTEYVDLLMDQTLLANAELFIRMKYA